MSTASERIREARDEREQYASDLLAWSRSLDGDRQTFEQWQDRREEAYAEGCPSNDHSNGDRDYTPHHHSDGGYALRHRWL